MSADGGNIPETVNFGCSIACSENKVNIPAAFELLWGHDESLDEKSRTRKYRALLKWLVRYMQMEAQVLLDPINDLEPTMRAREVADL